MIRVERKDIPEENKTNEKDCKIDILLEGTTWDLIIEYFFLTKKLQEDMGDEFWTNMQILLDMMSMDEINLSTLAIDFASILYGESNDTQ